MCNDYVLKGTYYTSIKEGIIDRITNDIGHSLIKAKMEASKPISTSMLK